MTHVRWMKIENLPKTHSVVLRLSLLFANFTRFALYNLNVQENILIHRITPHVLSHETHLISERRKRRKRNNRSNNILNMYLSRKNILHWSLKAIWFVKVLREGYKILAKHQDPLRNYIVASRQKLGIILENKVSRKLKLSKTTFCKECARK